MTQVSKFYISKETKEQIDNFLLETIAGLNDKKQASEFLDEFLTKTERIMLSKRLAIGILLSRGYDYREISRVLKVSTSTITTFAHIYKIEGNYKKVVDKIETKLKNKKIVLGISEKIASVGAIGGAKSAGWFEARNEIRKKKQNTF